MSAGLKNRGRSGSVARTEGPPSGDGKGKKKPQGDWVVDNSSFLDNFIILRAIVQMGPSAVSMIKGFASKKKEKDEQEGEGQSKKSTTDRLKKAAEESAKEMWKKNKIPTFLLIVAFFTCLLLFAGEGYSAADEQKVEVAEDFYGTLGVTRDADAGEIKRSYKTLARRWHPDKNPNCSTCQETFSKIATAYETLSDDKARASYDESGGIATAELKSPRSVPLTRENFDQLVKASNDVWIVQVFRPDDSSCSSFHPFWEAQIQKNGHLLRFGRIDVTNDPHNAKWLPVAIRALPTVLKFNKHTSNPVIFPITSPHETPQKLNVFALHSSFPNIGLPLEKEASALKTWLSKPGRHHKVLMSLPGRSVDERYKSHLIPRKMASRWSDIFEFRIVETKATLRLSGENLPDEVRKALPEEKDQDKKAAVVFFSADGSMTPKGSSILKWPIDSEDDLVLKLFDFAEVVAPALTPQTAELLCKSPEIRRVYCMVMVDPPDASMTKAAKELKDSRETYAKEVEEVRDNAEAVSDLEDFTVSATRLFRRSRGLAPSVASCRAPQFNQIEQALGGANAMLLDMDTGRIASLNLKSFANIYQSIAYEEEGIKWIDEAFHPILSLPDCDEGLRQNMFRSIRQGGILELLIQLATLLILLEAVAKSLSDYSWKWGLAAGAVLLVILLRNQVFLRRVAAILPGQFFTPTLFIE